VGRNGRDERGSASRPRRLVLAIVQLPKGRERKLVCSPARKCQAGVARKAPPPSTMERLAHPGFAQPQTPLAQYRSFRRALRRRLGLLGQRTELLASPVPGGAPAEQNAGRRQGAGRARLDRAGIQLQSCDAPLLFIRPGALILSHQYVPLAGGHCRSPSAYAACPTSARIVPKHTVARHCSLLPTPPITLANVCLLRVQLLCSSGPHWAAGAAGLSRGGRGVCGKGGDWPRQRSQGFRALLCSPIGHH